MAAAPRLALSLAILALASAPALAQSNGQGAPNGQQGQGQNLPAMLHLSQSQMGAYQNWMSAQQPTPDELARLRGNSPQTMASLTTPQRLDHIAQFLSAQQQLFQREASATRAFYGQLNPSQRQTFDQITAPRQRPQ